jgi:hypothetical protein
VLPGQLEERERHACTICTHRGVRQSRSTRMRTTVICTRAL